MSSDRDSTLLDLPVHAMGRSRHDDIPMRVVGNRKLPPVGLRGPTQDEIEASILNARMAPRVIPKGVYRYRSHEEANADMDRWIVEGMVQRARELELARERNRSGARRTWWVGLKDRLFRRFRRR